ncbi:MAG: rhomboid family intramembrane serine protease [Spirochaetaceae bacterium]
MIPIKDYLKSKSFPVINTGLIVINAIVFFYQLSLPGRAAPEFIMQYGFIAGRFLESPLTQWTTVFTSMFLHGGILHFGGNMLFLFVFGDNVEDALGHLRYLFYYLIAGAVAVVAQIVTVPDMTTPLVGASGAISAILGSYIVLYPMAKVLALIPIGFFLMNARVPAYIFLGIWAILQFFSGALAISGGVASSVAYSAHIGGFIYGVLFAAIGRRKYLEKFKTRRRVYYDRW